MDKKINDERISRRAIKISEMTPEDVAAASAGLYTAIKISEMTPEDVAVASAGLYKAEDIEITSRDPANGVLGITIAGRVKPCTVNLDWSLFN